MIGAYDKIYLERARFVMANMLDYAVNGLGLELKEFFERFLVSTMCKQFEHGDMRVVAGRSGIEIVYEVLGDICVDDNKIKQTAIMHRSPEYWLGWSLAYYQWYRSMNFSEIIQHIPIGDILKLYNPYHEMDIQQFVDKMDEICQEQRMVSRLKKYRMLVGLSQSELAEKTNIPVRTIQQYEQRQKNINKAQAEYLIRLAKALYCKPQDLMESVE